MLWRKGGSPWPFGGSRANLSSEGGKLKIKRLKPSDAAVYKCQGYPLVDAFFYLSKCLLLKTHSDLTNSTFTAGESSASIVVVVKQILAVTDERSPDTNLHLKESIEGGKRKSGKEMMGKSKRLPIDLDLMAFVLNICPVPAK